MVICKFFLQGTCKFGDSCRYSHQINDTPQTQGTSVMRQNSKPQQIDINLLVKSVVNDMTNAEKGGHWLLSSYAPLKDKPCFPGFENRSFEEVRLGYYEAMKNGTLEQYKQHLQMILQEAVMKMKMLQKPSDEIISMLIQLYNTPDNNQNNAQSIFAQSQNSSIFRQQQELPFQQNQPQGRSIFAAANQQSFRTVPGTQQAVPTNTNNIFSGATAQSNNQNVFSGTNSIFNKQQTFNTNNIGNSIFRNQGFAANTQNNSPFGTTNNTLVPQQNSVAFNQPTIFNVNNGFNAQPQALPFQNQTTNVSPFINQPSATNPLAAPPNSSFNFAKAAAQHIHSPPFAQQSQQTNIFAPNIPFQQQPQNTMGNIFNNPPVPGNVFRDPTSIFSNNQKNSEQNNMASIFAQENVQTVMNMGTEGSASIFSNNSQQKNTNSIFAQNGGQTGINVDAGLIDNSTYSKLEDLTESEIKSFESDSFEFGKIPEKPPTSQMCT